MLVSAPPRLTNPNEKGTMTTPSLETSAVALCLSAVARLHLAFAASTSHQEQVLLAQAAGDVLDHTVAHRDVKERLHHDRSNQVGVLVECRARIGAVPPGLWRKPQADINQLRKLHRDGVRDLERVLRKQVTDPELVWSRLKAWLEPAWQQHPQLRDEALAMEAVSPQQGKALLQP